MKIYDYAVLGAGIEGLIVSSYLAKLGKSVCLIEAAPKIGGNFKSNALEFFKDDETTTNALHFLGTELGLDFRYEKIFTEPMTFDKSFQPFVGFGDEAPEYFECLNVYTSPTQIICQPSLTEAIQELVTKFPVEVLTNSTLTHMEITENQVTEIILNGKTSVSATHFISTFHPLKMGKWNKDLLSTKYAQKLSKSKLWTTLALDLTHTEISNPSRGFYLLKGSKEDWFVGRFSSIGSQWLAFVSSETEADTEFAAHLFKDAKKAIAKAFPELASKVTFEKLSVLSESHGQIQFKMNQENPFQSVKNLWVCTGMATDTLNPVVASILGAKELLMDLQIHGYIENMPKFSDLDQAAENPASL